MEGTNTERFSESIGAIKGLVAKLASIHALELSAVELNAGELNAGALPASSLTTAGTTALAKEPDHIEAGHSEAAALALKTEDEVLTAIQERVACLCASGLWQQVQDSMKSQHQRDERRVWRQIVAAIRASDEAEASRLAKAAGIPVDFLKS